MDSKSPNHGKKSKIEYHDILIQKGQVTKEENMKKKK